MLSRCLYIFIFMSKILVIAEKPDMGRKIAQALKGPVKNGQGCVYTTDATVSWAIGHLMELAMPAEYKPEWEKFNWDNLPMIPDQWIVKVTKEKSAQFKILKELIKDHDIIVNAGDPGREGQLIIDEILSYLKCKKPVKRLLLPELRPAAIQKAWSQMQDNAKFFPLYQAGLARGYADWLVGLNATPAYTLLGQKKGYKGVLSVGRVQSPTLAIVVRRDQEIENFVPKDYYVLKAQVTSSQEKKINDFFALWKPTSTTNALVIDEEKRLIDASFANKVAQLCSGKKAVVTHFEIKDGSESPPMPFSLSKLQSFANSKHSLGAKEILDSCQSLYEKHEAQSYPRSDCQYLPEAAHADAVKILNVIATSWSEFAPLCAKADVSIKHSCWDDSKLTDHYAIIPTVVSPSMQALSDKDKKVYKSVCQRYLAQFFPACKFKTATIELDIEGEKFRAVGKIITDPGWRQVYSTLELKEEETEASVDDSQALPELSVGDVLFCSKVNVEKKQTKPPARFTEGSLIEAMANVHTLVSDPQQKAILKEKKGIGREATRTQIIENLIRRTLMLKEGKKLISSPGARALITALPSKVTDPALTAIWEDGLDKIAQGKVTLDAFMQKQIQWVSQLIAQARVSEINILPRAPSNFKTNSTSGATASPGAQKTSKSSSAKESKPKDMKAVWNANAKINATDLKAGDKCPKCSKGVMNKRVAKASGKEFLGCAAWPKCDYSFWPKN